MRKGFLLLLVTVLALACAAASAEGSLLPAVIENVDAAAGAHLNYTVSRLSAVTVSDAHAKGTSYCRIETTEAYGVTVRKGTCFVDDTAYSLQPDDKEAIIAISTSSPIIKSNVLLLDTLYKLIYSNIGRTDYTTETREVEGVSYTVEVYPGSGYTAEAAFYFDAEGRLAYIQESAPEAMPSLGEAFYTVNLIDTEVDESLFDLSGYEIVTLDQVMGGKD